MSKEIVSFPITSEKADELMAFYLPYQKLNNGEYIVFQAEYSGLENGTLKQKSKRLKPRLMEAGFVRTTKSVATKLALVISYFL